MPAVALTALGLTAGIAAGLLVHAAPWLIAPPAAALAVLCWRRVPALAFIMTAAAAGSLHGGAARRAQAAACPSRWPEGARVAITVEPLDLPALGGRLFRIVAPAGCGGTVRIALPDTAREPARRVVTGTWHRHPVAGAAALRAERAGVLLVRASREAGPVRQWRSRLRLGAEQRLLTLFGPRRAGLAIALTVSADLPLEQADREPYARAGLVHILSISGFHVGVLVGSLVLLLRAARLAPDAARLAAVPLVTAYIWLLGFPAPAMRSALLFALWAVSRARQRPAGAAAVIAASAIGVALADPVAVLEPGPWLSFTGAWGCLAASGWLRAVVAERRDRHARARLRLTEPVAVSAGALLATTPITLVAFGAASPVALVANIPAVPLAAAAVPAVAIALVLAVAGWAGGADVAAGAAGLALDGLELSARAAAAQPWAQVLVADRLPPALLAAAVAVVLLAPRSRSYARRATAQAGARLALASAVVLAAMGSAGLAERVGVPDGGGRLTVHFLAVGQGDAVLLRTPRGRWVAVDGGPRTPGSDAGRRRVVPFLRRQGAGRLAVLVATHGDADHLGGVPAMLDAFPADVVLEPGEPLGRPLYREFLAGAARRAGRWHAARAGETIELDGATLRVWHPDSTWMRRREGANENSVVLTVEYGGFRALLTGDAGLPMEAARGAAIGDVTLLKVGHHGSRSATGRAWLEAVRPEVCIVSVGENRYGHPHPAVLERLDTAGCATWRTDRAGDVRVETDGRTVRVRAGDRDTVFTVSQELP